MKLEATYRLMAAKADEKQAKVFLESLGFTGLVPKLSSENRISFRYTGFDQKFMEKHFGKPKKSGPTQESWKFGLDGYITLKEGSKIVVLQNSSRNSKNFKGVETHVPPEVEKKAIKPSKPVKPTAPAPKPPKVLPKIDPKDMVDPDDEPAPPKAVPPALSPNNPGSKDNDDSKVPVTQLSPELEKMYKFCQSTDDAGYHLRFNHKLWDYLNAHKFGGKMKMPRLGLLKKQGATKMRLRGRWIASYRTLDVSPRLYNASQNFFVEIFLHEMCHQAVSEIDRIVDRTEQGHGPHWRAWMRKVGLNPLRFDPNDNTTYMTDDEKDDYEEKKQQRQEQKEKVQEQIKDEGLQRMYRVDDPCLATVNWNHKIYHGMVACATAQNRSRFAFFDRSTLYGTQFLLVPVENIFRWNGSEDEKALMTSEAANRKIAEIKRHYERKTERRQDRKALRRMFGY